MSICPRSTPCRAIDGSAWWELCHDSPKLRIASGQKFADLSLAANGRSPIAWQIELIDQVTWCSRPTRTRLAQKNADSAPAQDIVISPPSTAGSPKLTSTSSGNTFSIRTIALSCSRSGVNRFWLVCSTSNSQPTCANHRPLSSAGTVSPYRHGECGSPSRSLNAWWRRWSATQRITPPSTASEPATASVRRSHRLALNPPWVK